MFAALNTKRRWPSLQVYIPCWPLREASRKKDSYEGYAMDFKETNNVAIKVELQSDMEEAELLQIRRGQGTDRPRRRAPISKTKKQKNKCKKSLG